MSQYRAYPAYKDSGVEWIGQVPEHWEVKPFKYILSAPMSYGANESAESDDPNHPRYIRITDLTENGTLREDTFKTLPWDKAYSYLLSDGDILLARSGATVGKSFLYRETNGAACFAGYLIKASCDEEKALPKYIYAYLQSHSYWEYISGSNIQSTIQNVSAEKYSSMVLPVPQREEQATIAAALDRETARIDVLIEKKTRFIELLKEKRQALITHAVTKGLDPNVKMKDSGVEWIGQVPEHWEVKRLRHVGRYSNSGVDKKSYEDQQTVKLCNYTDVYYNEFISDDMPFMQATASTREIEQFTLKKGDVIITKDSEDPSDIGIPAFVPHDMPGVICGYHLTMIRALNDNYGSYIHRSLQSDHTKAHFFVESPGITRYGLNQNTIGNAPVALPPPDEQATIAATLDRETARIDALIAKTQRSIGLLKERRSAFITAAVTGQIDLRGDA